MEAFGERDNLGESGVVLLCGWTGDADREEGAEDDGLEES
jgi:hypothetical protein